MCKARTGLAPVATTAVAAAFVIEPASSSFDPWDSLRLTHPPRQPWRGFCLPVAKSIPQLGEEKPWNRANKSPIWGRQINKKSSSIRDMFKRVMLVKRGKKAGFSFVFVTALFICHGATTTLESKASSYQQRTSILANPTANYLTAITRPDLLNQRLIALAENINSHQIHKEEFAKNRGNMNTFLKWSCGRQSRSS